MSRFSEDDILSVKRFPMSKTGGCHNLSRVRSGAVIGVQPGSKALQVVSIEGQGLIISSSFRVKRAAVCHRQFRHVTTSKRTFTLTTDVTARLVMTGSDSESK